MTDKTKLDITAASSENADEKKVSESQATQQQKDDEIKQLKAELERMKDVLKALQNNSNPMTTPQDAAQNAQNPTIKEIIANNFSKIERLVTLGRLTPQQGAILKTEVLQKAFGSSNLQTQQANENASPEVKSDSFIEFEKSNPDFFSTESRKLVKSYLQQGFNTLSQEELVQIADLVKAVEEAAIREYEQSKARENSFIETNNEAKKRLASNVLAGSKPAGSSGRIFTREEIGKMSPEDFRQNEAEIMAQLRKGQIK